MEPDISDLEDYGGSREWPSFSDAVSADGFPGADESATWLPTRAAHASAAGRCEGFSPRSGGSDAGAQHYYANTGDRLGIALSLQTTHDWVEGSADYNHLRLLKAGVAGAGKSFVTHAMQDQVRNQLGFDGEAKACAPYRGCGLPGWRALRPPAPKGANW